MTRLEPNWLDLDLTILCADCRTIYSPPSGPCPRCTSTHGISVAAIVDRGPLRDAVAVGAT